MKTVLTDARCSANLRGVKPKTKSKLIPMTVRLPAGTLNRLRVLAIRNGRSVAWMINNALIFNFRNNKQFPEWR
ncbi:MAG: hypothetical protein KGJ13_10255 [Patescibacteria group bacterium]|nr:hypothetical protein [Patescibacteria group bacterium]